MDVFLGLRILSSQITNDEWLSFYNEARQFVTKCRPQLGSVRISKVRSLISTYKRLTSSEKVEIQQENALPLLRFDGTLDDLRFGDPFCISPSLSSFRKLSSRENEDFHFLLTNSCPSIFYGKTQGYPYHYAVLALGILAENHFPGRALVHGDFSPDQVQRACAMLHEIFARHFSEPFLGNPHALVAYFSNHYDEQTACEKTFASFRCDDANKTRILASVIDRNVLEHWQAKKIARLDHKSREMIEAALSWLNATADPASLIRILSCDKKGPMLSKKDCASVLASTGIALPTSYAKKMADIREILDAPEEGCELFELFLRYAIQLFNIACLRAQYCLGKRAVCTASSEVFPDKTGIFKETLLKETEDLKECIDIWHPKFQDLNVDLVYRDRYFAHPLDFLRSRAAGRDTSDDSPKNELTQTQKEILQTFAEKCKPFVESFLTACKEIAAVCQSDDVSSYAHNLLFFTTEKHNRVLSKAVWEIIDAEQDATTLCFYAVLLVISTKCELPEIDILMNKDVTEFILDSMGFTQQKSQRNFGDAPFRARLATGKFVLPKLRC